jgi:hypothetical protein
MFLEGDVSVGACRQDEPAGPGRNTSRPIRRGPRDDLVGFLRDGCGCDGEYCFYGKN